MNDTSHISSALLDSLSIDKQATAAKPRNELGQAEFFKLMIAQLQSQDPLKPLESNEFIAQVAQFSQVEGIQNLQTSFSDLANSLQSSQALQASTLVGRHVLVPSNVGSLASGGSLNGRVELPQASAELALNVFDANGQLVRQMSLGAQPSGLVPFSWDGMTDAGESAPAGAYSLSASAFLDGETVAVGTLAEVQVESVTLGRSGVGTTLNLFGLGSIGLEQVRQIL